MVDYKTFLKYAVVGASGVAVNTLALYTLTEFAGLFYIWSGIIAAELSIITNFICNDIWTFSETDTRHRRWKRFLLYNGVSIFGTVVLITVMAVLTTNFGVYYIFANWIGVGITFIMNYLLNKRITWKQHENSE